MGHWDWYDFRRLLHRKSTAISDEESIGRIWGIEAWTPEQHNERQVLNIRRSPGLIAAATLCVLNDAVKARHLCFEAYEEILDQLRSIPPLAEECRRSILGTIPLIRESEALANTETHSGQLWINPNYLIEHIPSIRHVLSNELINEIIEGKINKKEIQLWQTQHFESNDLCYFDPIMISDLCTIRLRAIINLVEKVYLDNVQGKEIILRNDSGIQHLIFVILSLLSSIKHLIRNCPLCIHSSRKWINESKRI